MFCIIDLLHDYLCFLVAAVLYVWLWLQDSLGGCDLVNVHPPLLLQQLCAVHHSGLSSVLASQASSMDGVG